MLIAQVTATTLWAVHRGWVRCAHPATIGTAHHVRASFRMHPAPPTNERQFLTTPVALWHLTPLDFLLAIDGLACAVISIFSPFVWGQGLPAYSLCLPVAACG